jgi:hypothetical protein
MFAYPRDRAFKCRSKQQARTFMFFFLNVNVKAIDDMLS